MSENVSDSPGKLTQSDLAKRESVSVATVRRWKRHAEKVGVPINWADEIETDRALVELGKRKVSRFEKKAGVPLLDGEKDTAAPPEISSSAGGLGGGALIDEQIALARQRAADEYRRYDLELSKGVDSNATVAGQCLKRWEDAHKFANSLVASREKQVDHDKIFISRSDHEAVYAETMRAIAQQIEALQLQCVRELEKAGSLIDAPLTIAQVFDGFREYMRRADFLVA